LYDKKRKRTLCQEGCMVWRRVSSGMVWPILAGKRKACTSLSRRRRQISQKGGICNGTQYSGSLLGSKTPGKGGEWQGHHLWT